jgi:YD repeat-containing protein
MSSPGDPAGCTGLSWTYDPWGNRTDQTQIGGSCGAFHVIMDTHANNRFAGQSAGQPYTYDAAGNLTYDGTQNYTYDAENRIISTSGTLGSATYVYDANGHRIEKITGTNQDRWNILH